MATSADKPAISNIPSIDKLLARPRIIELSEQYGRELTTEALRFEAQSLRQRLSADPRAKLPDNVGDWFEARSRRYIERELDSTLRAVINLTGTVLHTNLGRAPLPEEAIEAIRDVAGASSVEFDLDTGRRGDRDDHVERWLRRLIGCEAATIVNNNAAAVVLTLNTLARRKEVPVSRGELIEIGGAFRIPDVMSRAGCKLVEVGTTNRTHARDYESAIGPRTACLMKVHPSNYEVQGFAGTVDEAELAEIAHRHDVPLIYDLGSGAILDLSSYGVPREPMPAPALKAGVDLVTFSGDKLLGGPQCGIIAGKKELVDRIKRNPLKRSLRLDKLMLAALEAVLKLYADPEKALQRLPTLRLLSRPEEEIRSLAQSLLPAASECLPPGLSVRVEPCNSQVGSGALPTSTLPSWALVISSVAREHSKTNGSGSKRVGRRMSAQQFAAALRRGSTPVLGRIHEKDLWLDLRCLEDCETLLAQLQQVSQSGHYLE